jgi:hypothetical protein
MRLMPSKHWKVRQSGDLCRLQSTRTPFVQKLVEIAHTDQDGIVHEQTRYRGPIHDRDVPQPTVHR